MTNDIVPATADTHPGVSAEVLEQVVVLGNLEKLTASQRLEYYNSVCRSLGLNPLTRPFEYIELNGRLTLYARRDATDQLRNNRHVAVEIPSREKVDDIYIVTARGTMPDGRTDESIGAVPLSKEDGEWKTAQNGRRYFAGNGKWVPLQGDERANALMKAETKAKRRVTLSICGLGFLDETEIETVATATRVSVDAATGEILAPPVPDTTSAPKVPPASTTRATPPSDGNVSVSPPDSPSRVELKHRGQLTQRAWDLWKMPGQRVLKELNLDALEEMDLDKLDEYWQILKAVMEPVDD